MGVSIKEAMACKIPVVASNSGGIPEAIIDGENGFIIGAKNGVLNETLFVDALKRLYKDESLSMKMGAKGYQIFNEKFTNKITLFNYLSLFEDQ